jgi:hypothetical protein
LADPGLIVTATTGGAAVTVTLAEADWLGSATLLAVTVSFPAALGAVYKPLESMLPSFASHVTEVLLVPVTVAVNCCFPLVCKLADVGLIVTDTNG